MKVSRISSIVGLGFAVHAAAADFTDMAQVMSVTPIYERVADTRQECYMESVPAPAPQAQRNVIAPVIGGIAGAVIGSQVGSGRGRDAATAVGAVVGTVAADRMANPNSESSIAGAAVGGAAGAVLGSQVGSGSGRTAATGAGAIAGAVAGDRVASGASQRAAAQPVQRCRAVDAGGRDVIRAYNVVYRYNGRDMTTTMPYDPGHTVRVSVGVIDSVPPPAPATVNDPYGREYAPPPAPAAVNDPYRREYAPPPAPRPVRTESGYTYRY